MSLGIERERERHGHPHTEEVTGRSIAHAVHQIDELLAAIAAVRLIHKEWKATCTGCWRNYPCPTIRALPDEPDLGGDAA